MSSGDAANMREAGRRQLASVHMLQHAWVAWVSTTRCDIVRLSVDARYGRRALALDHLGYTSAGFAKKAATGAVTALMWRHCEKQTRKIERL